MAYPQGMAFWRSWVRALLGASGVTLLVPAGLVLAVALAATLGGGGFGGLGQLVNGPALPGESTTATDNGGVQAGVPALPGATAAQRARAARRESASGEPKHPAVGHKTPASGVTSPTGSGPDSNTPTPEAHKPPSGGGTSSPGPKPPTTTSPITPVVDPITTPVKSTLHTIGDAVQSTLNKIPVIGKPLADAVGTVVDLLSNPTPQQQR